MAGTLAKKLRGFLYRHVQYLVDVAALVADFERFAVVARAVTEVAGN